MADRDGGGAFRALVAVDLRRMRRHLRQGVLFTAAAMALSILAGHGDPVDVAVVLAGSSFYYFLWPPLAATMDRLDGGLEFLTSVPVSPGVVAGARLTGIAIATLPVALYLVLAFAIALGPALGVDVTPGSISAVLITTWVSATGLAGFFSGLIVRFGVEAMGRWPAALAILGLGGLVLVADRHAEAIQAFLSAFFARTGWAWGVIGLVVLLTGVTLVLGYRLTTAGLAGFQPERGRLKA